MKGEIELYNISFLILKVELHFKVVQYSIPETPFEYWTNEKHIIFSFIFP